MRGGFHLIPRMDDARLAAIFGREVKTDLVRKELRLTSISSIDAANRFLESYLSRFNVHFEREALRPGDLHRPSTRASTWRKFSV